MIPAIFLFRKFLRYLEPREQAMIKAKQKYILFILRQHTVSNAKLIDDVAFFAGRHAHFLADILHVDLAV